MKAFIVATMLVAAVAGQSFNMFNKFGQDKSILMNKFYGQGNELMYKKLGYPMENKYLGLDKDLVNMPIYNGEFLDTKIFTIEELYTTQLFKEYLTLPLFRQYITVPEFQKFVQSVYFQKFWTVPAFKEYFVTPALFYKYIYPIVQLFKYDITTMEMNKNVLPVVSGYEKDLYLPTTYNMDLQDGVFYKELLEQLYNKLYKNQIVDPITKDIKMIPFQGVDTIFTEPLVKDILLKKFLINNKIDLNTIFQDKLITELMMKKNVDFDLLKQIILSHNVDSTVFGDKTLVDLLATKNVDIDLVKYLLTKKIADQDLIKKVLAQKLILGDDMMMNTMLPEEYLQKMMITGKMSPVVARMIYGMKGYPYVNKYDTLDTVTKMNLFDVIGKKFETIDAADKLNLFDILSKKDLVIKDKILLNKILADKVNEIDNFGTYETVFPKMVEDVTKFNRVPLTLDEVKPMMGVRTFDKKVFPEIIKA